jgi:phosphoribosyl 1,2-cyclic phosphodiesterase
MNARLNVDPNVADPDAFYELLVDTHQDLRDEQSRMLNAQLVLLLSNHIGDLEVLREAFAIARRNVERPAA